MARLLVGMWLGVLIAVLHDAGVKWPAGALWIATVMYLGSLVF